MLRPNTSTRSLPDLWQEEFDATATSSLQNFPSCKCNTVGTLESQQCYEPLADSVMRYFQGQNFILVHSFANIHLSRAAGFCSYSQEHSTTEKTDIKPNQTKHRLS